MADPLYEMDRPMRGRREPTPEHARALDQLRKGVALEDERIARELDELAKRSGS